jgi:uncharacterized protein (TIGR03083 family)
LNRTVNRPGVRRPLTTAQHLERLRLESERLADVAGATPFDSPVPGCPGWDVDALLRHMGDVHRWATAIVRDRLQQRPRIDSLGPEGRDQLLSWYRDGLAGLIAALEASSPNEEYWAWGPAPNAQAFWARRQSHETAIHRLDAEQAAGLASTFPADAAADGVDEWLVLAVRRATVPDGGDRRLRLRTTDTDDHWQLTLAADSLALGPADDGAGLTVAGPAGDLFALVMNRRDLSGLEAVGDADVIRAWRDSVKFT